MTKRGQLNLSFGMIFSVILIIIFIIFAFYAIGKFLDLQNSAQIGKFKNDLQSDINRIWQSSKGSQEEEYFLPTKIKYVCFVDYHDGAKGDNEDFYDELELVYNEEENMFFYPVGSAEGLDATKIKNIDLGSITQSDNPYCFENANGRINLIITKDFGEALVSLERI